MRSNRPLPLVLAALAIVMVLAGIYWTFQPKINGGRDLSAHPLEGLNVGAMANFTAISPETAPEVVFSDGNGEEVRLSDWQGKVVLLNVWATWCGPCRHEMPALDRLQAELGSDRFEVVALSLDRSGLELPRQFYEENGIERLALYNDPTGRSGVALGAFGMPTTVLIDGEGRLVGRLVGPAEWDVDEAKALIRALLEKPSGFS
jgi:thiol-disulfide isomerase/thioredoxin